MRSDLKRTVRSLIKVDLPAPLGPITPTRLNDNETYSIGMMEQTHLDSDRA